MSQSATVRRVRAMSIRDSSSAEAAIDGIGGRYASCSRNGAVTGGAGVVMQSWLPVAGCGKRSAGSGPRTSGGSPLENL